MRKINILVIPALLAIALSAMGQAKKPTLMVVPSDQWCNAHGYTQTIDDQGETEVVSDYKRALQNDKDLNNIITKIGVLMADRGFPLKDLQQSIKNVTNMSTEDLLITSKSTGSGIAESPLDKLRRTAKADILLEVNWQIETMGPKQYVTFSLKGLDSYTGKAVAGAEGTGAPSFSATAAVLLEEACQNHLDAFASQLQAHFDDMFENGREITIDIRVFNDGSGLDLEQEYDGFELSEIIDNLMAENTVNHRFNKSDATENYILFEQVRIPLYKDNGTPQDADSFTRNLMRYLRQAPYSLPCKIINRGLGRCLLVIGEK